MAIIDRNDRRSNVQDGEVGSSDGQGGYSDNSYDVSDIETINDGWEILIWNEYDDEQFEVSDLSTVGDNRHQIIYEDGHYFGKFANKDHSKKDMFVMLKALDKRVNYSNQTNKSVGVQTVRVSLSDAEAPVGYHPIS